VNILLVYPKFPDTFWSFKHALSFIGKKVSNPPLGLLTIAAILPKHWMKILIDTNITELKNSDIEWADYVFVSAMDIQRSSCRDLIRKIKQRNKIIVAGGPLFSAEYQTFPEVDHFILNEGEVTLPQFISDIEDGKKLNRIYSSDLYADISKSPPPDLSLIKLSNYDSMCIQFSRGCPFQCDFCNVTVLLGHKPRMKTAEQIVFELDQLYRAGWRRNIFFVDDNFIGNKKYLIEIILPALIDWRRGKIGCLFITEASINLSDDPELMHQMRLAGFVSAFIGIETPNEKSLVECNKKQNTHRDLLASIERIHNSGIQVMAGFIVGFDNDTPEIFDSMIHFIQESGIVTAMVGLLQAPYGTDLYKRLESENRILREMSGDNADGSTNIIPIMDPVVLSNGYKHVVNTLYSPEFLYPRIKTLLKSYKPKQSIRRIQTNELFAFIKTIFLMGFNPKEAKYYWNLLFWTLSRYPSKFDLAVTLTIYGYHFRKVNTINQKEKVAQNSPAIKVVEIKSSSEKELSRVRT
jgi:radical SAM superfamily enzyme YgiQ (UPF0313 family)